MPKQCQPHHLDWYQADEYFCVRNFKAADWFLTLNYRQNARETDRSFFSKNLSKKQRWDLFSSYRQFSIENLNALDVLYNDPQVEKPALAIQELESGDQVDRELPFKEQGIRVLEIDPDASDVALIDSFLAWLESLRADHPLPKKVPGRKKLNVEITDTHLGTWSQKHVLECFDVDFWAEIYGFEPLSHENFFELIFGSRPIGSAKEWGRSARDATEDALNAVRLLAYSRANNQSNILK